MDRGWTPRLASCSVCSSFIALQYVPRAPPLSRWAMSRLDVPLWPPQRVDEDRAEQNRGGHRGESKAPGGIRSLAATEIEHNAEDNRPDHRAEEADGGMGRHGGAAIRRVRRRDRTRGDRDRKSTRLNSSH